MHEAQTNGKSSFEPALAISVVIPTRNRAYCLKRSIESVLSQTYPCHEIIVVDDGSNDDTRTVIHSISKEHPSFSGLRYIFITPSGVSAARNTGIRAAAGEWIALLDSDDYWLKDKLQRQVDYLSRNTSYRICHTDEIWIRNGIRINQAKKHAKYEGWFFRPSLHRCLISPSSVLLHRSVFTNVGIFDVEFPYVEDYELWLRITARYPIGYVNEKLVVKTGGHPDQLSKKIQGIERFRMRALKKLILGGFFNREQCAEAASVYLDKAAIYIKGCRRRGRNNEVRSVQRDMEEIASYSGIELLVKDIGA